MKIKKIVALIVAATMITFPMTVFADTTSGTETGGGSSEGNPAEDIFRVVLPTTTDATYDFTMDPNDLLSTSSLGGDRDAYDGSSVYFSETSAATVELTDPGTLYAPGKVAANLAALNANITVETSALTAVAANSLYVWTPKSGSEATGIGEWTVLTIDNIADYFDITYGADAATAFAYAETTACDGLLYYISGVAVTDEEAFTQCTVDGTGAITDVGDLCTDSALTTPADAGDLTYTAPATTYTDASATATAVNKSTFGVVLNVQVDLANTTTPVELTTTAAVNTGEDLNFAVDILGDDASAVSNVLKNSGDNDGTTNVDFYLSGAASNYTQYQGAVDADTGGHTYNYLEKLTASWSDVDFGIQAACNTGADWSDYNTDLTALNRIVLDLTFTMTSTDVVAVDGDNYDATTGVISLIADVAPSIADVSYDLVANTALEVVVALGSGATGATDIASVEIKDGAAVDTGDYSFATDTITFTSDFVDAVIAAGGTTAVYTVTFNDSADTAVDITLTLPDALPTIGTTSYALTADEAEAVTVTLGAGADIATGLTSVADGATPLTVTDDYTFAGTTLTFTSAYVNEVLAAAADKTITVTFNDTDATEVEITLTAPVVAASVTPETANFSKATGGTVTVNLGSGSGLSNGITKLDTVVSEVDYIWADGTWSLSGTTLTLSNTAALTNLTVGSTRVVKVTFESGATDTFTVTITN